MENVKRTYRDIMRFREMAEMWQRTSSKKDSLTGFQYAIGRVLKSTLKAREDYLEDSLGINIDCASTDGDGNLQNDPRGNMLLKPDKAKERLKRMRDLDDIEVGIGVYFAKIVPPDLTPAHLYAFEGFVIPEPAEPAE